MTISFFHFCLRLVKSEQNPEEQGSEDVAEQIPQEPELNPEQLTQEVEELKHATSRMAAEAKEKFLNARLQSDEKYAAWQRERCPEARALLEAEFKALK